MKRILLFAAVLLPFFFTSCGEGPPGLDGLDGLDGRDGLDGQDGVDGEEAFVFEFEFSFNRNDFTEFLALPSDFTLLESDVILVYFLWEVDNEGREIWRLLPQTVFTPEGILQFNFDHTRVDASVFLEADFNLNLVGSNLLDDWIARVVVVPGQFNGRLDFSDYDSVKERFNLSDTHLTTKNYIKRPQ